MSKDEDHKNIDFTLIISILILLVFLGLSLSLTFSMGVCCGDDAYFAVVAKNLANGLGYSSSFYGSTSYALQPFDIGISSGPSIILPASLIIKIFGNTYWAPGLANVILWFITLLIIGIFLRKSIRGAKYQFIFFSFSFLFLCFSLMAYHLEHWFALLGEVPSALFIILGVLIFLDRDTRKNQFLSGLVFSFAFQAKFLALAGSLVFLVVQVFLYRGNQSEKIVTTIKKGIGRIPYFGLGFLIPILSFEIWKLATLGTDGFLENWRVYLNYIGDQGTDILSNSSLLMQINNRFETLWARFGISLIGTSLIVLFAWFMLRHEEKLRRLFYVFCAIIAAYSFWWFFNSNGWARYYIISLVVLIMALSLPLLAAQPKPYLLLYFVTLVIFSSPNWPKLSHPYAELKGIKMFSPAKRTIALLDQAQYLNNARMTTDERIVTIIWSTAADLEYIMPSSLNFTSIWDKELLKEEDYLLALNTRFVDINSIQYPNLVEDCQILSYVDAYFIGNCKFIDPE